MQDLIKFHERQAATSGDMTRFGEFARTSFDDLVSDAIEPGLKFVGFAVVASGGAAVTVGEGRFYKTGEVYYDETSGGLQLNLISKLATTTRRIIAITVSGAEIETDVQPRTFITNVETRATEARAVPTVSRRKASFDTISGSESNEPQRPAIPAGQIAVAWVTVSTTAIISIETAIENELFSLRDAADQLDLLNLWRRGLEPRLTTIGTDIGNLAAQMARNATREKVERLQVDMARVKELVDLPDEYTDYGSDVFLDTQESDTAYAGYAARIDNGLNFPFAAKTNPAQVLALANPSDATVKVTNGLVLPAYQEARIREIRNSSGDLALNQFLYDNHSLVVATMKPTRTQHGPAFLISSSSSWWGTGRYLDIARGLFEKDGQYWTVLPAYEKDAAGADLYRVYSWIQYSPGPGAYWTRNTSGSETVSGHQWAQTFYNSQDRWLTGLGLHFYPSLGNGNVTIALCECDERAEPDASKVLAMSTLTTGQFVLGPNKFPITPTFIEKGKRYGVLIMTAGNYSVTFGDASGYLQGTLFFRNSGGHWESDPAKNLLLDLYVATFANVRTVVPLAPISLAGGLSSLDLTAPMVNPASCELTFEAQVGGTWYSLSPKNGGIFNGLPELVNLRAVLAGSNQLQPGFRLPESALVASRVATAMKHASTARTTPSSVNQVKLKVRLEHFDPAHNTVTLKVDRGGTIETADLTTDRTLDGGIIERTCVFNLAASTSSFKRIVEGTSDHHTRNFVVSEITDITDTI